MPGKGDIQATPGQRYTDWVRTTCEIAQASAFSARLDDALSLLNSDAMRCVELELAPQDWVRLQVQRACILRYKGWLNNDHRTYDAALAILSEAEEIASDVADLGLQADLTDLIGVLSYLKEFGQSTLAVSLGYFERGLAMRKEAGDQRDIAASLLHLGWVYQHREGADEEDAHEAFRLFQQAYHLAEHSDDLLLRAEAARHMADVHRRRGELDEALARHLEFVTIAENTGCRLYLPPGYTMVGISYLMRGDPDQALSYCERAYALAQDMDAGVFAAEALFGIGAAVEAKGDPNAALAYYRRALAAAQATDLRLVIELATRKIKELSHDSSTRSYLRGVQ
jgi:tetratricopeptide (TPR) repeat protein